MSFLPQIVLRIRHIRMSYLHLANFGSDYFITTPVNMVFVASSGNGSTRCLDFIIFEEGVIEPDETVFISMALLTHGRNVMLGNSTTTLTLMQNGGKI